MTAVGEGESGLSQKRVTALGEGESGLSQKRGERLLGASSAGHSHSRASFAVFSKIYHPCAHLVLK